MRLKQPSSRSCFVCGRENAGGLRARWTSDRARGEAHGSVSVPEAFNGYPGVVHGGILAALLDEAMVRAVLVEGDFEDMLVTAKLEIVYRRPTPTATPLAVVGRLSDRRGSRAHGEAEIRLPDGEVSARATALLARPPPEVAAAWAAERPFWRVDPD